VSLPKQVAALTVPAGTSLRLAAHAAADLPDVNVWLALSVQEHPHHQRALHYWQDEAASRTSFCRITMLGLVRLLCQPRVMGTGALDTAAALQVWKRWLQLPEIVLLTEAPDCETHLQALCDATLPPRLLTDAYLAAFASSGGLRLVSFDSDFHRFSGLDFLHLKPLEH